MVIFHSYVAVYQRVDWAMLGKMEMDGLREMNGDEWETWLKSNFHSHSFPSSLDWVSMGFQSFQFGIDFVDFSKLNWNPMETELPSGKKTWKSSSLIGILVSTIFMGHFNSHVELPEGNPKMMDMKNNENWISPKCWGFSGFWGWNNKIIGAVGLPQLHLNNLNDEDVRLQHAHVSNGSMMP